MEDGSFIADLPIFQASVFPWPRGLYDCRYFLKFTLPKSKQWKIHYLYLFIGDVPIESTINSWISSHEIDDTRGVTSRLPKRVTSFH